MEICHSLGETLWPTGSGFSDIEHDLKYLVYQRKYSHSQKYWVASVRGAPSTIDANGCVQRASAETHLPVLCTHSAPYSTLNDQDTNSTWQVTIHSNNEYLTG